MEYYASYYKSTPRRPPELVQPETAQPETAQPETATPPTTSVGASKVETASTTQTDVLRAYIATLKEEGAQEEIRRLLPEQLRFRLNMLTKEDSLTNGKLNRLGGDCPEYLVSYLEMRFSKKLLTKKQWPLPSIS